MARPWLDALLVFEHDIPETQPERIFGDAILHPFLVQFGVLLQQKLFVFDESEHGGALVLGLEMNGGGSGPGGGMSLQELARKTGTGDHDRS